MFLPGIFIFHRIFQTGCGVEIPSPPRSRWEWAGSARWVTDPAQKIEANRPSGLALNDIRVSGAGTVRPNGSDGSTQQIAMRSRCRPPPSISVVASCPASLLLPAFLPVAVVLLYVSRYWSPVKLAIPLSRSPFRSSPTCPARHPGGLPGLRIVLTLACFLPFPVQVQAKHT